MVSASLLKGESRERMDYYKTDKEALEGTAQLDLI